MRLKCLHFLGKLRVNGQTSRTIFLPEVNEMSHLLNCL